MPVVNPDVFRQHVVNLKGKDYLMVVGAVKAAHMSGDFLGSETPEIRVTDTHLQVKVRVKFLNRHLIGVEGVPQTDEYLISYWDGVAEHPLSGAGMSDTQKKSMLEDLETSALGRALSKAGFALNTMATAEEVRLNEQKTGSGYEGPKAILAQALREAGINTKGKVKKAFADRYGENTPTTLETITDDEARLWVRDLIAENPPAPEPEKQAF